MCQSCGGNCNGITLFSGTDGVGITSITDNNNGTFTILLSNGTTWTSGNYTGPAGTNAFKFVKDFSTNNDGGIITITRDELTSCSSVPNGCLFDGITAGFTNLQVQVWLRGNDPSPSGPWVQLGFGNGLASLEINADTGIITATLSGSDFNVIARMVVIA